MENGKTGKRAGIGVRIESPPAVLGFPPVVIGLPPLEINHPQQPATPIHIAMTRKILSFQNI